MIEFINHMKTSTEIITYIPSLGMSAAAFLYCCGDRRFMSNNATIMFHAISVEELSGNASVLKTEIQQTERLDAMLFDMVHTNTGKNIKSLLNSSNNEIYMDAKQALKNNICTDIGIPGITFEESFYSVC